MAATRAASCHASTHRESTNTTPPRRTLRPQVPSMTCSGPRSRHQSHFVSRWWTPRRAALRFLVAGLDEVFEPLQVPHDLSIIDTHRCPALSVRLAELVRRRPAGCGPDAAVWAGHAARARCRAAGSGPRCDESSAVRGSASGRRPATSQVRVALETSPRKPPRRPGAASRPCLPGPIATRSAARITRQPGRTARRGKPCWLPPSRAHSDARRMHAVRRTCCALRRQSQQAARCRDSTRTPTTD